MQFSALPNALESHKRVSHLCIMVDKQDNRFGKSKKELVLNGYRRLTDEVTDLGHEILITIKRLRADCLWILEL